jgi:isoleucyl-tRNA synthetase
VFYEGPPTANGRPGIHHVFSRTIKDSVSRFRTMQGRWVPRMAGWDTHGLPVEIEAEKKLGISGKREIEAIGIARFNEVCRESVLTYTEEWERFSARIGYWLDYSRPYVTYRRRVRRERVVAAEADRRSRPVLPRPQDPPLLPALRHRPLQPRGGAGLQGREGPVALRHPPPRR